MNNPFDLANYKPQVRFDDLERSRRSSYQATQTVNKTRKQGIEPSRPYSEKDLPFGKTPETMVVEMPTLPVHERTLYRRKQK